jgi:hypothetical protein
LYSAALTIGFLDSLFDSTSFRWVRPLATHSNERNRLELLERCLAASGFCRRHDVCQSRLFARPLTEDMIELTIR